LNKTNFNNDEYVTKKYVNDVFSGIQNPLNNLLTNIVYVNDLGGID
jgi:hypothetical protein